MPFKKKGVENDDLVESLLSQANVPFVYMHHNHQRDDKVYPTVQVICAPIPPTQAHERESLLEQSIDKICHTFTDFTLLNSSADGLLWHACDIP